jgi:hypothetical protein
MLNVFLPPEKFGGKKNEITINQTTPTDTI